MAQLIRVADELYVLARNASQALNRPLAQQTAYWVWLEAALKPAGNTTAASMKLLGYGATGDAFVSPGLARTVSAEECVARLQPQRKDAEDVRAGRRSACSSFTPGRLSEFHKSGDGW